MSARAPSSQQYVHTEFSNKAYKRTGGKPKNAQFVTEYRLALSMEQIRANHEEMKKCETALKKYYTTHKYVKSCTINSQQKNGYYTIKLLVVLADSVEKLNSIGEASDRVELIEMMTFSLRDA